jgi:tripartite-type tricarboxylate transporter receptor subunit TctC
MNRWIRRAAAATAVAVLAGAAHAQAFPSKPLRFVVPFPAGSATDSVARIVAQAMGESLAQPVAVENKPGANGILGAEAVKAAAPDGYMMQEFLAYARANPGKLSFGHGSAGSLVSGALVASMGACR